MKVRKALLALTALAVAAIVAPTSFARNTIAQEQAAAAAVTSVKLLAFNDFHGHLEPNTPGTTQIGCCVPNPTTGAPQAITVPAGGAEYFATHLKNLGSESPNTYVVSAGDLIGASPLLSGLFHDEPTIEFMNHVGLDANGVGNHEFDEGAQELLRMQFGNRRNSGLFGGPVYTPVRPDGCHPEDGCQDGTPFFGSVFQFLAANVVDTNRGRNPLLPEYQIVRTSTGQKVAFIGETLEGTPLIVTPSGVAGLEFLDEADTVNALVPVLKRRGVETMVLLLHQGGFQNPPPASQGGFVNRNACQNFSGPELLDIVNRLNPEVDVVVSAHTHQPYICSFNGRLVTSASSFGRLITSIDLTIDNTTGEMTSASATNNIVTQNVAKDPGTSEIIAHYKTFSDPIAKQVVGSITASLLRTDEAPTPNGESPLGDVIADAQLEATAPSDFGGSVVAFMNPGGIRGPIRYTRTDGQPQDVTYENLFTVQPFGNTLVVKTCTGAQIDALLEQQFTVNRRLQISDSLRYSYSDSAAVGSKVDPATIKINGVTVNPAANYRVTMNSFLADGGDGFTVFRQCTDQLGGEVDLDALVRYFMNHSPISPPPANRITRLP
jgi:5'-nucleotidase